MVTGRIRRSARRGIAAAVLGWLCVAAASVVLAPSASAAPSATVEIRNVTPPAASVDKGGTVTFVNKIPAQNKGGISIPLVGSVSATVFTDVSVAFFGQTRTLATDQSAKWTFDAPATTGTITYTYRIVPQSGLAAGVADQVVDRVAATLPALPAPTPYVVQTIAPDLPNAPSVNVPQLPTIEVPDPTGGGAPIETPVDPGTGEGATGGGGGGVGPATGPDPIDGDIYTYGAGGAAPQMKAIDSAAARAFDPARFTPTGGSADALAAGGSGAGGGGGVAGSYDGASVPVFGQLAGLDGAQLDDQAAGEELATSGATAQTLPAAALAAVIALATATAALVRTHQAHRTARR
jgi:hypothetical protein